MNIHYKSLFETFNLFLNAAAGIIYFPSSVTFKETFGYICIRSSCSPIHSAYYGDRINNRKHCSDLLKKPFYQEKIIYYVHARNFA